MKKIGESFKGILGGLVFVIIGVVLLWWNEGNNVRNLKTTKELEDNYVEVASGVVDKNNEGKLVVTSGIINNEEELEDQLFGIKIKSPKLIRVVEVYQWEEESQTDDDNTTYSYKKVWSNDLIDSSSFHTNKYNNPTVKEYDDVTYTSSLVKLGAFTLSNEQVSNLSTNGEITSFDESIVSSMGYSIVNKYITNTKDMEHPEIGDFRIHYEYNNSSDVTVLAVQKGESFVSFVSKAGKTVNRITDGTKSGQEMINIIKAENKLIKWILRLVGTLLIISGICALFKPITTIANFVPILGGLVNTAVGLVGFLAGGALSLLVIAIAWIRYRPVLGICLLLGVLVLVFILIKLSKNKKQGVLVSDQAPVNINMNTNMENMNQTNDINQMNQIQNNDNTQTTDNDNQNMNN